MIQISLMRMTRDEDPSFICGKIEKRWRKKGRLKETNFKEDQQV